MYTFKSSRYTGLGRNTPFTRSWPGSPRCLPRKSNSRAQAQPVLVLAGPWPGTGDYVQNTDPAALELQGGYPLHTLCTQPMLEALMAQSREATKSLCLGETMTLGPVTFHPGQAGADGWVEPAACGPVPSSSQGEARLCLGYVCTDAPGDKSWGHHTFLPSPCC